jgi:hypothetical protein
MLTKEVSASDARNIVITRIAFKFLNANLPG